MRKNNELRVRVTTTETSPWQSLVSKLVFKTNRRCRSFTSSVGNVRIATKTHNTTRTRLFSPFCLRLPTPLSTIERKSIANAPLGGSDQKYVLQKIGIVCESGGPFPHSSLLFPANRYCGLRNPLNSSLPSYWLKTNVCFTSDLSASCLFNKWRERRVYHRLL